MKARSDCARFHGLQDQRLVDAPLSPAEQRFYVLHREQCPTCKRESALLAGLPALCPSDPGSGQDEPGLYQLAVQIVTRCEDRRSPLRRPALVSCLAGAATLAVLLVLVRALGTTATSRLPPGQSAPGAAYLPRLSGGELQGRHDGQRVLEAAAVGIGQVVGSADGPVALRFGDGTQVWVESESRLQLSDASARRIAFRLEQGSAVFSVTHRGPGQEFLVGFKGGEVRVIGTRFRVVARGETRRVQVAEGVVSVTTSVGASVRVVAGECYDLGAQQTYPDPEGTASLRASIAGGSPRSAGGALPLPTLARPTEPAIAPPETRIPEGPEPAVARKGRTASPRGEPVRSARHHPQDPKVGRPESSRLALAAHGATTPAWGARGSTEEADVGRLLEKARNHLNQNDFQGARDTYLAIVKRFPGAAEAQTCLVQIGNLSLAHLGDAAAGLEHFERYLRRNPAGLLAEEAAWGRVSALSRLGRIVEERVALEEFLRRYPRSAHAAWVEKRLQALSKR